MSLFDKKRKENTIGFSYFFYKSYELITYTAVTRFSFQITKKEINNIHPKIVIYSKYIEVVF